MDEAYEREVQQADAALKRADVETAFRHLVSAFAPMPVPDDLQQLVP